MFNKYSLFSCCCFFFWNQGREPWNSSEFFERRNFDPKTDPSRALGSERVCKSSELDAAELAAVRACRVFWQVIELTFEVGKFELEESSQVKMKEIWEIFNRINRIIVFIYLLFKPTCPPKNPSKKKYSQQSWTPEIHTNIFKNLFSVLLFSSSS